MNQSYVRLVKLFKMTVRTSVLWKMKIHMAKYWPEKVVQRSFIKEHSFPIGLYLVVVWSSTVQTNQGFEKILNKHRCSRATFFSFRTGNSLSFKELGTPP